MKAILNAQQ